MHSLFRLTHRLAALTAAAVLVAAAPQAIAADEKADPPSPASAAAAATQSPDAATIDRKIAEVKGRKDLDAAGRDKIVEVYQSARSDIARAATLKAQTASYKSAVANASSDLDRLDRSIAALNTLQNAPVDVIAEAGLSSDELAQVAVKAQAEQAELRGELSTLDDELMRRAERASDGRRELADAKAAIQDIGKQMDQVVEQPASALREARLAAMRATLAAKRAEAESLEQEIVAQPTLLSLAQRRRDEAQLQVAQAERRVKALDELVNKRRVADSEAASVELEKKVKEAAAKHPILEQLAATNSKLGAELAELTRDIERVRTQRDAFRERSARIEEQQASLKERVRQGSLSEGLARVLYEQALHLPERADFSASKAERERTLTALTAEMFRLEQREGPFQEVAPDFDTYRAKLEETIPKADADRIAADAWALLQERRALVGKIKAEQQRLFRLLDETDVAQDKMLREADELRTALDRILFWVPVSQPGAAWFTDLAQSVATFLSPARWFAVLVALWHQIEREWPAAVVIATVVALLLYLRRACVADLKRIAGEVRQSGPGQMRLTLRALLVSLLIALPWPVLAFSTGWALSTSVTGERFTNQIGTGLVVIAVPLLLNSLLWTFCAPYGAGPAHFQWRSDAAAAVRKAVWWLIVVLIPAAFVSAAMGRYATAAERATLGRIAFICVVAAYAWALFGLLRFDRPPMRGLIKERPEAWIVRYRYVWFAALTLLIAGVALIAAGGYLYAARSILQRLANSMWLVVVGIVVMDLIARWLLIERGNRARAGAADAASSQVMVEGVPKRIEQMESGHIDHQTRQFVGSLVGLSVVVGLFLIWRDAIPALSVIGNIALWNETVTLDGQAVEQAVTLADVALAIVIAFAMVAALRNVGGVLEMILPMRLRRDTGIRFAIGATVRYVIFGVGFVSVLSLLGVPWSKLQWLVAAMGVGLGFGLQEIVANFVSGLIILYERPIRIGDTITVGDVTGVVSNIEIRATTLTDADRRDVLIPNKSFITQQVINWTLSDPTSRLLLTVGVAYGTDPEQARRVILEAVKSCPTILREPSPSVVFSTFSASSLDFEIRAFARHMDDRLPLRHEINTAIASALKAAGIEIPFPQQDIYIKSLPESVARETEDGASRTPAPVPPLNVVRKPES